MSYYYLATPYTRYAEGIEAAYRMACGQTALLMRAGVPVFSPIAHTHGVAIHGGIHPTEEWKLFMSADRPMMDAALGCIVVLAHGWSESKGVAHEIEVFKAQGKPVIYMAPGVIPRELRGKSGAD